MANSQKARSLLIQSAGATDKGKKRENNEDCYLINDNLFIVADGLGGHNSGEKASQITVNTINNFLANITISNKNNMERIMKSAFEEANDAVLNAANVDSDLYGMGTTLIVAFLNDQELHIAHVGDVRAYLIRNKKILQLTDDHSVSAELLRHGHLKESELKNHPLRNRVTRSIGHDGGDNPDYNNVMIQAGDYVLLCSDGLWNMLPKEVIKESIVQNLDVQINVSDLIAKANDAGGDDNITVVVIRIGS